MQTTRAARADFHPADRVLVDSFKRRFEVWVTAHQLERGDAVALVGQAAVEWLRRELGTDLAVVALAADILGDSSDQDIR